MTTRGQVQTGAYGFGAVLTVLFIGLKLGAVITWSWWLVLSPLFWPLYLVLLVGAFALWARVAIDVWKWCAKWWANV